MQRRIETIATLATRLGLLERVKTAIGNLLPTLHGRPLLDTLVQLPVRPSHALRSLGSYVTRNGQPHCIRLQFRQAPEQLKITLLHELAHACDHLVNQPGQRYRRAHGPGWKRWAAAFDIDPQRTGHCEQLEQLRQQRLKPVAFCQRCGIEIQRLRRLPANRSYIHPGCGGRIVPLG